MRRTSTAARLALAASLAVAACKTSEPEIPRMSAEEAMARTIRLGAPGPRHRELAELAGTWRRTYRFRFTPGAEWHEATGLAEAEMLCDGRFLLEHSTWHLGAARMESYQLLGYDNLSDEYVSLWFDSTTTWWTEARGKRRPDGLLEFAGRMRDAAGGRPFRLVQETRADGSVQRTLYDTSSPEREVELMSILSRR